jgi:large subunit ribosomal protein L21
MFAVIKTGGRQYRVAPDDVLEIGRIDGQVGTIIQLGEVLLLGGDTPLLGTPTVPGASVAAEVLQQSRGAKVIAFKKRRRKNSRRKRGYRDELTVLRITEILADNAKPSIGPRPKKEKVARPADEADDDKRAAAKKAAVKKTATNAATVKPAAKQRAKANTKKPAAKEAKGSRK